ncbi:MAG TPA: extracellular solute-binding protein, partial [Limnochordia bacterium]|nr:extracellular solute-binding protein [Limnochordia bacterium]
MSRRFLQACFLPVGLVLATQSIMAAESETIDLDVVMDHTQSAVYDPLFKEFEALHPDVKFKLQVVPAGTTDVIAKIAAQFATGDPPDIILQFGAPDAAQNGEILDLWPLINTDPAFKAQFPPAILDEELKASEIPGKMFSFPVSLSVTGGMVYRKSLLTAAGFPLPHDGWTKEEFLTDAEKLTLRDPDGNYKRMGYNPTKNGWDAWLTESMQQPEYNPATMEWFPNEQAAEEAFQWATDLLSTHAVGA